MLRWFMMEESGQAMVEYGVILTVIAVVAMAGFKSLGTGVDANMDKINAELASPSEP